MPKDKGKEKVKTTRLKLNELTLWKTGTIVFAILFIISWFTGGFSSGGSADDQPNVPNTPNAASIDYKVDVDANLVKDAYATGDEDAPVTMIEFSDFQCPFCGRFFAQTLPEIEKKYIETGKVKFVYMHLPLSSHKNAQKAAEAAECGGEQGKFWEMHDKIFQNQEAIGIPDLKKYAGEIEIDTTKFDSCLDSNKMADKVNKHSAEAARLSATGTPTFFINGVRVIGAQPFNAFQPIIDAELAK